ncbi:hypothetical protein BDR03DRAFT_947787 [Suillus americanus]|nr:hypothetical protein BDR03DRAFT_947787 [Suillus americanus]
MSELGSFLLHTLLQVPCFLHIRLPLSSSLTPFFLPPHLAPPVRVTVMISFTLPSKSSSWSGMTTFFKLNSLPDESFQCFYPLLRTQDLVEYDVSRKWVRL